MRRRARTILEKGSVSIAIHPNGVGGIEGREPHVELDIGALRIFVSVSEWKQCQKDIIKLLNDIEIN